MSLSDGQGRSFPLSSRLFSELICYFSSPSKLAVSGDLFVITQHSAFWKAVRYVCPISIGSKVNHSAPLSGFIPGSVRHAPNRKRGHPIVIRSAVDTSFIRRKFLHRSWGTNMRYPIKITSSPLTSDSGIFSIQSCSVRLNPAVR